MFSQAVVGGIWLALLGISPTIPATLAQDSSNVTCMSSFYWANNDMGQNPCIVASYLDTQCPPTGFTIEPVSAGIPYEPPAGALANACECNTVLYSLMSACAACQGATYLSWASWTQACNETSTSLLMGIPPGTAVPAWAFIGIDAGGTWNETAALLNASATSMPAADTGPLLPSITPIETSLPRISVTGPSISASGIAGLVLVSIGGVLGIVSAALYLRRRYRRAHQNRFVERMDPDAARPIMSQAIPGGDAAPIEAQLQARDNADGPGNFTISSSSGPSGVAEIEEVPR